MISSGHPVNEYIDGAVRHVMLRQGVLGIKVRASHICWRTFVGSWDAVLAAWVVVPPQREAALRHVCCAALHCG